MPEKQTPKSLGYRWPAEWEPHEATWLSWPHNRDSWPGKFTPVPEVFARFARTIAAFEPVHILGSGAALEQAEQLVGGTANVLLHEKGTNDCWIRDHGPWFLQHAHEPAALVDWGYNAWGNKYPPFDLDNAVPEYVALELGMRRFSPGVVMEGGSIENNGQGTLLVTSQCLLNPNRNPDLSRAEISRLLCEYTGADRVLWLFDAEDGSIPGDDTDAHIDQLARFVTGDTLVAVANDHTEQGRARLPLLDALQAQLKSLSDAQGQPFTVIPLPLPDPVFYEDQQLPASYANFYIGNGFLIYPTFRCSRDDSTGKLLKDLFPGREIIGLDAVDLVWGLGAFHCASMQQGLAHPGPAIA